MVWGMNLPSGFGEFWPSGEFEGATENTDGWWDRLSAYFREQMPKEQKAAIEKSGRPSYAGFVVEKFRSEPGSKSTESLVFTPVEVHEAPRSWHAEKTHKQLGSLIMFSDHIIGVDEALKDIIERLEPGVHGFFPIDIVMPRGVVFPKKYYTLVIGQWFDSFLPDKSGPTSKNRSSYVYSKNAFGKAHLWRDRRTPAITCFSDELYDEIMQAGLRIPKHYKMKEV